MGKMRLKVQNQFHRSQIGRAQRFVRLHLDEPLTLASVAKAAGSSCYHFARLFLAYTGETPFDYLRRLRLVTALRMLQEDQSVAVTEIALNVGYETPSAFNKAFKRVLDTTPSEFRNLGKETQNDMIYDLCKPRIQKEIIVNLSTTFEIITRPAVHYFFLERVGAFSETAPPMWDELCQFLGGDLLRGQTPEFLGLSTVDKSKAGEESMIYQAGVGLQSKPKSTANGLHHKNIASGKYARFLLTGPYSQISAAFNQIFRVLGEKKVTLRPEFCIENYLNDPKTTPANELKTELLVPIMG